MCLLGLYRGRDKKSRLKQYRPLQNDEKKNQPQKDILGQEEDFLRGQHRSSVPLPC